MAEVAKHKSQRSDAALTPEVRIAFPFVHEKRTKRANGEAIKTPRFDATILVPKLNADPQHCANYQALAKHCMDAAVKAWGSWPQGGHWPVQDGDTIPPQKPKPGQPAIDAAVWAAKFAWRKGCWFVEATNYMDPGPRVAIMQNGQAVEIPARVINGKTMYKSGDYGIVSLHAYTFQNEKFGVNFGLEGILWTREGEQIGSAGQRSAAQMFGSVATMATATPAYPPGIPQPSSAAPPPMPPQAPVQAAPVAPPQPQQYAPPPAMPMPPQAPVQAAPLPPLPR